MCIIWHDNSKDFASRHLQTLTRQWEVEMSAQSKDSAARSLMMAASVIRWVSLPPPTPIHFSKQQQKGIERVEISRGKILKIQRNGRKEDFCSLYCQWFEHRGEDYNLDKGKERANLWVSSSALSKSDSDQVWSLCTLMLRVLFVPIHTLCINPNWTQVFNIITEAIINNVVSFM